MEWETLVEDQYTIKSQQHECFSSDFMTLESGYYWGHKLPSHDGTLCELPS